MISKCFTYNRRFINTALSALLLPLSIFLLLNSECRSLDYEQVRISFNAMFPGKELRFDTLDADGFRRLINEHIGKSPAMEGYGAESKRLDYSAKSIEESFKPNLFLNVKHNAHETRKRTAIVKDRVPVKWDNDNPERVDFNLPNGGKGIMWVPKPLEWARHDFSVRASYNYNDQMSTADAGLQYRFPFGLSLNPVNYHVNYRTFPKIYGLPWSNGISTSFGLPLFRNFGYYGSMDNINLEDTRIEIKINELTRKTLANAIVTNLTTNFINLYFAFRQYGIAERIDSILTSQAEDVDVLTGQRRITVAENLSVKSSLRKIKNQEESLVNDIILYSSQLNLNPLNSKSISVYIPELENYHKFISAIETIIHDLISSGKVKEIIRSHPRMSINNYELDRSELTLKYAENQNQIDVQIQGSMGVFQINTLGFDNYGNSMENFLTRPDGYSWNFGIQYNLPLGKAEEYKYMAAKTAVESQQYNIEEAKRNLSFQMDRIIFTLKKSHEDMQNSEKNLDEVIEILKQQAEPLFQKKRLNRYDYNSYLKQIEFAKIDLFRAEKKYIDSFIRFCSDMYFNMDLVVSKFD